MYSRISFVAVLVLVGLPIWWKTTEVYRVALPYKRIANLNDLPMKMSMTVQLAFRDLDRASLIKEELEQKFAISDAYILIFEVINLPEDTSLPLSALADLEGGPGSMLLAEWPWLTSDIKVTLTRTILFRPDINAGKLALVLKSWVLGDASLRSTVATLHDAANLRPDTDIWRRVAPTPHMDITLSVVSPSPELIDIEWDPREAMEQYLLPFVSELSALHNFTLKSQWLYFLQLNSNPKQVHDQTEYRRHFALSEDVLPHLITPLEKRLASHISQTPCLNLVLYAPPCEQAPIYIYRRIGGRVEGEVDGFLSWRWGGMLISNPPAEVCQETLRGSSGSGASVRPLHRPNTREVMGAFLAQLRLLLGLQDPEPIPGVELAALTNALPRQWELDSLYRSRAVEQVKSATLTLQSIAQLLGEISNIVINDDVGASIYEAVMNVELTSEHLQAGRIVEALECSGKAYVAAEAAFTDPSLLTLLYFPDDQKYAVYIPLYLPVMIPVVMSARNLWYWLRGPKKEKTE